jgi:NodT family efflux transporter outer membrane factor (OMF) lipoprotein
MLATRWLARVDACRLYLVPLVSTWLLSACAGLLPPTQVASEVAPAWQTRLPHQGQSVALAQWWQQQGDVQLVALIDAAQAHSPTLAQAAAHVAAARANQATARAALLPNLNAQASASRGVSQSELPLATTLQAGLQASWELDLFGANRVVSQAAQAQVQSRQADWHEARVSLAAEVAGRYFSHASCRLQLQLAQHDVASRAQTARLGDISVAAGLLAAADAALTHASAADAASRATQLAAQCDLDVKALVALTALAEPDLRQKLLPAHAAPALEATFEVASVPAQAIAQRPDVFAAERAVLLAAAQVGSARAQRLPGLSLNGSIGAMRVGSGAADNRLTTWSFGPLALRLPLFDAGQRAALVDAASAAYAAAVLAYQGQVRQAVREVEEALVKLHSASARLADAGRSAQGYAQALAGAQSRYDHGLVSLNALEDARRAALAAESGVLALALERRMAWVLLYRAVGGGFDPERLPAAPEAL